MAACCVPVAITLVLSAIASFASAQDPGPALEPGPGVDAQAPVLDTEAMLEAAAVAQVIQDEAVRINSDKGVFCERFAERLLGFYQPGEKWLSGSADINREFARPYVIGLLRDLFFAGEVPSEFDNPLDEESRTILRGVLGELILTAADDLEFDDRLWLWDLAAVVCDAGDVEIIRALDSIAADQELSSRSEQSVVRVTANAIRDRAPVHAT